MKRKIFSILTIALVTMASCKKEVLDSNQLGEAIIKGNVYANLDETNDVNSVGIFSPGSVPEQVEDMMVSVEIDTRNWDQTPDNSYNYPKKTYTATTNANGDYTLTIPATEKASNVTLKFNKLYTTKKKYTTDGSELIEEVYVGDNSFNVTIFSGAVVNRSDEASVNTSNSPSNEYGSAKIRVQFRCNSDYGPNSTQTYDPIAGTSLIGKTVEFIYAQGQQAPDGSYNNPTVFSGKIVEDPINPTYGLVEMNIPTFPTGQGNVYITGVFSDFQGTVKKDDGTGVEKTQNAIWNLGNTYSYMFNLEDGDIDTYGVISIGTTEN